MPFPSGRAALVGVVHLQPLPGSPLWEAAGRPSLESIVARALSDAEAYLAAGFDGVIVENFGDAPFFKRAPLETVACLTRCARAVVEAAGDAPVGVNVLRNDGQAALSIALATGARFVRINVLSGAAVTDQGLIEGEAATLLRLRAQLGAGPSGASPIALLADVHVKHAQPLAGGSLTTAALDTAKRGLADALIVSGAGTGFAPSPERLREAREAVPETPLWLGSGLSVENCAQLAPLLSGAIVGSAAETEGRAGNPVDPARARAVLSAFRAASP
ncbi:MAG: BtpA/SgcQ family protein [Planctomycetes bacterium]|nr:BtpA/SgcQ family protein [Planctomycetota bacterium]